MEPLQVPYPLPEDRDNHALPLTPLQVRLMWSELESLRRQRDDAKQERLQLQAQCEELAKSAISPARMRLLRNELEALRKQRDEAREEYRRLQAHREGPQARDPQQPIGDEADREIRELRGERDHLIQERDLWKQRCEELAAGREGLAGERIRSLERALSVAREEQIRAARQHRDEAAAIESRLEAAETEKGTGLARAEELRAALRAAEAEIRRLWAELSRAQELARVPQADPLTDIFRQICDDLAALTARRILACRATQDSERAAWDEAARRLSTGDLDADGRLTLIGTLLRRLAEQTGVQFEAIAPAPDSEWDSVRRMITSARAELAKLRAADAVPGPALPREEPRGRPGAFIPRAPRTKPHPFPNANGP